MNKVLLVQFKLDAPTEEVIFGLKVRALLVFSTADSLNRPVERCAVHWSEIDTNHQAHNIQGACLCPQFNLVGHVITTDCHNATYDFDPFSGRHSVTIPMNPVQPGCGVTTVAYTFNCKTSCQGGMARRPTYLIFTLENNRGDVFGRSCQSLKVCSCPKRDKEREEADFNNQSNAQREVAQTPSSTKRSSDSSSHWTKRFKGNTQETPIEQNNTMNATTSNWNNSNCEEICTNDDSQEKKDLLLMHLVNKVESMNNKVESMNNSFQTLGNRVSQLTENMSALGNRVSQLAENMSALVNALHHNADVNN